VEELVHEIHAYFSCNTKRFEELKQFSLSVGEGKKLLKYVETRWISMLSLQKEYLSNTNLQ